MARKTVAAEVESDVHHKLRVALLENKLAERNFSEWLRAREAEALVGLIKRKKRK